MLPKLSQAVVAATTVRREYARKAERASDEEVRADFLRLQQNWLNPCAKLRTRRVVGGTSRKIILWPNTA
jgi:hypothetical protein